MRAAALLLLAGCAQIFGLSAPHPAAGDAAVTDAVVADTPDGQIDLADAAPGHCVTIADCPTSVCLPSTLCAADTDVAWLDPTGSNNGTCTMAMPCSSLNAAMNTSRPYIRVHGAISQLTNLSRDVSIFAEPGGAFTGSNIIVNSGNIGFYDLEFANSCLSINAGTTTAEHIYAHGCNNTGITANGTLILDGSSIAENRGGGVDVRGPGFTITNNLIFGNGTIGGGGGGTIGGVAIEISPLLASRIDFNTIVVNGIKSGSNVSGGLYCNVNGFTANGNVLAANLVNGSPGVAYANQNGACQHVSAVIQPSINLGFVNAAGLDFHITATSSLRDAATVSTGPTTDVDGESRPEGSAYDIGADEYHP